MEILKESKKEDLPVSFMTSFISKGWDDVGQLKEQVKAVKEQFKGSDKVANILQDLIDAYLVCIGQLELHLNNNDYLDYPAIEELTENVPQMNDNILSEELDVKEELPSREIEVLDVKPEVKEDLNDKENFEYFCDFEEPVLTDEDKQNYEDSLDNIR